jgi:hypothetical protein
MSVGRPENLRGVEPLLLTLGRNNHVSRRSSRSTKGALNRGVRVSPTSTEGQIPPSTMGDAELQTLHVRVIALESLVVSLLASASDRQRKQAETMAAYISPRSGITQHQLTVQAATHIIDLVKRAAPLRRRMLSK